MNYREQDNQVSALELPKGNLNSVIGLQKELEIVLRTLGWSQEPIGKPAIDNNPVYWNKGDLIIRLVPHTEGGISVKGLHKGLILEPKGMNNTVSRVPLPLWPKEMDGKGENIRQSAVFLRDQFLRIYLNSAIAFIQEIDLVERAKLYFFIIPDQLKASAELMEAHNKKPKEGASK